MTHLLRRSGLVSLLALSTLGGAATAQEIVAISTNSLQCAVQLTDVVTLGSMDEPGTIGLPSTITQLESGDFVLASAPNGAEMLVYDAEGRYRASFGRDGDGPGEFRAPGMGILRPTADGGLRVLDPVARRITNLSGGWDFSESTEIGDMMGMNFLTSGSDLIVGGWSGVGGSASGVTRVIEPSGLTRAEVSLASAAQWLVQFFFFPMTVDSEGIVWRARPTEYAIEAWDPEESAIHFRLEGSPLWFTPGPPQPGYPLEAPSPSIIQSLEFHQGLLWIGTSVADSEWSQVKNSSLQDGNLDANSLIDTVLEVVDPQTGALVARAVHPEVLWWTGDGAFLFSVRHDNLVSRAILYFPSLTGPDCPTPGVIH